MIDELLKFLPYTLKMDTEDKCVLELIVGRKLSYKCTNLLVKLFERGCTDSGLKTLTQLTQRRNLEDSIVSS